MSAVLAVLSAFASGANMSSDVGGGPSTAATRTADEIAGTVWAGAGGPQQVAVEAAAGTLTVATRCASASPGSTAWAPLGSPC